jgi:hypothetical protein
VLLSAGLGWGLARVLSFTRFEGTLLALFALYCVGSALTRLVALSFNEILSPSRRDDVDDEDDEADAHDVLEDRRAGEPSGATITSPSAAVRLAVEPVDRDSAAAAANREERRAIRREARRSGRTP